MSKLLRASFFRLRKNKIFWFIVILSVLMACFQVMNNYKYYSNIQNYVDSSQINYTDNYIRGMNGIGNVLINYVTMIGIFISMFVSLFVGTEYSDGVIRNKIIAGHSRTSIYISNLIVSIVGALIFQLVYSLTATILSIPILNTITTEFSQIAFILFMVFLIIVEYASIFNMISLVCSKITMSTVICMMLVLVMFMVQFLTPVIGTSKIAEFIYNITPMQQAFQIVGTITSNTIYVLPWYALGLIFFVNLIGLVIFKRKDLK